MAKISGPSLPAAPDLAAEAAGIIAEIYDEDAVRHDVAAITADLRYVLEKYGPAFRLVNQSPWALASYYLGPMFSENLARLRARSMAPPPAEVCVLDGQWLVSVVDRPPLPGELAWFRVPGVHDLDELLLSILDDGFDGAYGWVARDNDLRNPAELVTVLVQPEEWSEVRGGAMLPSPGGGS